MGQSTYLLEVKALKTFFYTFEGVVRAVDDVSFFLNKGEVLGIVGESGCGKSVTANSIMRLIPEPPGKIVQGKILFDGMDFARIPMKQMRKIRGNRVSMIFQEPMTSLNPVFTIGDQISEMFRTHEQLSKKAAMDRATEMLQTVQIPSPEKRIHEYPYQLSGGMRQRVMIAMALACNPEILIADEPTTALDVTIQAQIIDLVMHLKNRYDTGVIMITHDLGVIAEIASRIVVMYAGKVIEEGNTKEIFQDPKHPYTRGLLKAIPKLGERSRAGDYRLKEIPGTVPDLINLPTGCSFYPRCDRASDICLQTMPEIKHLDSRRKVRCWVYHR